MPRTIDHPALKPLKDKFPDVKLLVGEFRDMVTVVVPREHLLAVCMFLRDDHKRTGGRETRLDRQNKGQEGTTPQLSGKHTPKK